MRHAAGDGQVVLRSHRLSAVSLLTHSVEGMRGSLPSALGFISTPNSTFPTTKRTIHAIRCGSLVDYVTS